MKNEIHNNLTAKLLENAPAIIVYRDLNYDIKWVNTAYLKATGLVLEEIIGKKCYSVLGLMKPCRNCPNKDQIKTDKSANIVLIPPNKTDRLKPQELWVGKPELIKKGDGKKIIGVMVASYETKDSELAIWKSEVSLREAERLAHIGHWELDFKTKELFWSDEIYHIFEIEPSSYNGSHEAFLKIIHPDDRKLVNKAYKASVKNREPYAIDHRLLMKDDRIKIVHEQCKTYYDNEGKPSRSLGTVQDMTEQKQREDEHNKLQAQFSQAQKMESIGRLAGGVAHDFNNMLSVILGYVDLALEQIDVIEPLHDDFLEIHRAAKRAAELTQQLLAFARKQIINPKLLDLNEIVGNILKLLHRLIGEDIDLIWIPGANLGVVNIDPSQIEQILANLCVNARDAIPGVGKITIETHNITIDKAYCDDHHGFSPGSYVVLAVSDDGSGMEKDILNQLYDPFFTTKEMGKSTGLGLATVYGIVKQNDGFINVYSELGEGTTFKIYLSREKPCDKVNEIRVMSQIPEGGNETILLVENEAMILNFTIKILETLGYHVFAASTPSEVFCLVKDHKGIIDLLITDVVMPEINGRDLSEQLKLTIPNIKILYMSGYTANVIAHHDLLGEGVNFIQKPFSKGELAIKIREVITVEISK